MTSSSAVPYRCVPAQLAIPAIADSEIGLLPDAMDVAVGLDDRLFVLAKRPARVYVFDAHGTFLTHFGDDMFCARPHSITCAGDGSVWVTDIENHVIRHFSQDGTHLGDLGSFGVASDSGIDDSVGKLAFRMLTIARAGLPFHDPTCLAVAPNQDLYVSDGYGNAAIHHFDPDGNHLRTWGGPGSAPGRFRLPHAVAIHDDEVVVCDQDNERLQFFGLDGAFRREWPVQRPAQVTFDAVGRAIVISMGWNTGEVSFARGRIESQQTACVSVLGPDGTLLDEIGNTGSPWDPGTFVAAHGIAIDSRGIIYVADTTGSMRVASTLSVEQRLARKDAVARWAHIDVPSDLDVDASPSVHVLVAVGVPQA